VADLLLTDVRRSNIWPVFVSVSYLCHLAPIYIIFAYLQKVSEFSSSILIFVINTYSGK
jgi:hypothetical protein